MSDIDGGSNADHSFETKDAQQQTQSPSFLGNRKGLFGNSAILLKSPTSLDDKESTTTTEPKISHKEVLPNNDSSNTEKSSNGVKDAPIALEKETVDVDMENGDSKEPEDNGVQASDPPVVPAEGNVNEDEVVEEEPCVKKIVSVCTEDNDEGVDSAMESAETESVSQEPSSSLAMEIGSEESEQEKYDQPEEEVHDTITTVENVDDESTATAATEGVNESEEKEDEKESENADTTNPEEKEETEEPKKRRGRPSRTPARNSDSVASEETETTEKTPKRGRRSAVTAETVTTPATATPTPGRGRGRPARTPKVEEEKEKELPPQSSSRGRRGKKASEGEEMEQETEKETPSRRSTRAKKASESTIASKSEENVEDEAEAEGSVAVEKESESDSNAEESTKTPTRGRGRRSVVATSASKKVEAKEKATPTRKAADKTPSVATASQKRSRGRPGRPPKGSEEPEEVKETEEDDEEEEESPKEEVKTPKRGRKPATAATPVPSSAKSVKATPKSTKKAKDEDDPYDFDIEVDNHPEPLKNIQMEVQSFGQVRYSKVGVSTSKYEQTEKAAQERIPNLLDISSGSKVPEKRKSLMELNKKEMELSAAGSKSVPARRRKKQEDEDDEMDFEDATTTPKKRGKALVGASATPKTPSTAGRKRKTSPSSTPIPKSKQPKVEVPQLDAVSQLSADLPEDGPPGVVPGSRVYALYDKVYYPAIVINRDGLGRFQVYFVEDAIVKELPEASVIPIASLNNGKLAAINNEEDTVSVHVISVPKPADWLGGMFELETVDDETKTYSKPWDQIMLAMEDWKEYIKAKSAHATDVKTDNIESTEDRVRRRRSTAASSITTTSSASSSKTPSKPKTPRSVKAKVDESMNMETDEVAEKKTPVKAPSTASSPIKRRGRPSAAKQEKEEEEKKEKEEVKEEEKEEKEEKPVEKEKIKSPVKVSSVTTTSSSSTTAPIFDRKVFILTSANRPTGEGKLPFRKNEMKLRILERGGHVVDDIMVDVEKDVVIGEEDHVVHTNWIDEQPANELNPVKFTGGIKVSTERSIPLDADAYLISDTYYRTHKFLAALARNMPCVSHEWIHFCVVQEQLLDYHSYQMQAGVSLLDTKVHDAPDVRGKLLVGLRVCVHSTNEATQKVPSFTQIWAPIVEVLGGDLRTPQQALDGDANVLVTDTTCDPQFAATVSKKGVEVVSSEWLIQAIIMGIRPPYDGHPRFRHEALTQDGQGTVSNA